MTPDLRLIPCLLALGFLLTAPGPPTGRKAYDPLKIEAAAKPKTVDLTVIDESRKRDADLASRLAVFPALPPGAKYELVLDKAEHSAFTDRALPGDREPRNPNHHRVIMALSTAFWDAWLGGDAEAKAWLAGDGPVSVLEKADRWQKK